MRGLARLIHWVTAAVALLVIAATPTSTHAATSGVITTVVGGFSGDGGAATSAILRSPWGVEADTAGDLYIADEETCNVRRVSGGLISTLAGDGTCRFGGDGGAANDASLNRPIGIAIGAGGDVYIAEAYGCRVRKVSGGIITTIAGNGTCGFGGDGGPATMASLEFPAGVAVDASGNVYIADANNCRVRQVSGSMIVTVAGTGMCSYSGDGGAATAASLNRPWGIALDGAGNLYIADRSNYRVREVSGGIITTVYVNAIMNLPSDVAVSGSGDLYIADQNNCRVLRVSGATTTTVAGSGTWPDNCGYSGDGGPASSAKLASPSGVALDGAGNLYIADRGNCAVREVNAGTIVTAAGNGTCGFSGDGGAPTDAALYHPFGLVLDGAGTLYIADSANCRIRALAGNVITTVAGDGVCGYGGDGGPATSASLNYPASVATDGAGNLYIGDRSNCRVRKVSGGSITSVAGNGDCFYSGYNGDLGWATSAVLHYVSGIAVDGAGNLYIAEAYGCRIRKVTGGIITTVAGNGTCGYAGDGGNATSASIGENPDVAVDATGNLYIADNCRVRRVSGGIITTVAGSGSCVYTGDGPAASAGLDPHGISLDHLGNLYIADYCRLLKVTGEMMTTAAGSGVCGYDGDGGPATSASLRVVSVAVDRDGNIYMTDSAQHVVRKVAVSPASVGGVAREPDSSPQPVRSLSPSTVAREVVLVAVTFVMAAAAWALRRSRGM